MMNALVPKLGSVPVDWKLFGFFQSVAKYLDVNCSVCPTAIGMKEENYRKLDEESRKKICQRIT